VVDIFSSEIVVVHLTLTIIKRMHIFLEPVILYLLTIAWQVFWLPSKMLTWHNLTLHSGMR